MRFELGSWITKALSMSLALEAPRVILPLRDQLAPLLVEVEVRRMLDPDSNDV